MIINLGDSVIPQENISELKELLKIDKSNKTFADVYARVSNFTTCIGDLLDDEKNPFPFNVYKEWEDFLCYELHEELDIRRKLLGIEESYHKIHTFGHAFLYLFGYVDSGGLWFGDEKYEIYDSKKDKNHHIVEIEPTWIELFRVDGILQLFDTETLGINFITSEGKDAEIRIIVNGFLQWWESFIDNCNFTDLEINPGFDLKEFHEKGLELAKEIRKQLPDNFTLYYRAPYEDCSGIIKDKVLIPYEE